MLAQKGITFQIEELSKPEKLLDLESFDDICKRLILSDEYIVDVYMDSEINEEEIVYPFNIIAKSKLPDSLLYFRYHSFFNGMYQAYADHRPFVLSPDMIWLLISQGFARHVNANQEKLRHHFADFSSKLSLIVSANKISLDNPNSPWEKVFPEFNKQIAKHTGIEIIKLLSANFTTTTAIEKLAFEVTIMEAMKSYFEFIVETGCGIPEITLQGTTKDWQKILDKTKQLNKYDLEWWTKELEPVLKEFVNASKGKINKKFWQDMFKYHLEEYEPDIIDGWIVKFFPYDKYGNRNNLNLLIGYDGNLPEEIVKVDLQSIDIKTGEIIPLELWAGFFGLEQNSKNYALTPKIGWMIRKKDVNQTDLVQKLERRDGRFEIRVKEFPTALLSLKEIEYIYIYFLDEIIIPDEFANVKIKELYLSGKITEAGIERIIKMFPDTHIIINEE
jgi:hypothetical protein